MGSEIALLGACAGLKVSVYSRSEERFTETKKKLGKILRLLSRDDKFFAAAAIADDELRLKVLDNLGSVDSFGGLGDCDCVIESIAEDARLKREVFTALSAACSADALLASNTSSI